MFYTRKSEISLKVQITSNFFCSGQPQWPSRVPLLIILVCIVPISSSSQLLIHSFAGFTEAPEAHLSKVPLGTWGLKIFFSSIIG